MVILVVLAVLIVLIVAAWFFILRELNRGRGWRSTGSGGEKGALRSAGLAEDGGRHEVKDRNVARTWDPEL